MADQNSSNQQSASGSVVVHATVQDGSSNLSSGRGGNGGNSSQAISKAKTLPNNPVTPMRNQSNAGGVRSGGKRRVTRRGGRGTGRGAGRGRNGPRGAGRGTGRGRGGHRSGHRMGPNGSRVSHRSGHSQRGGARNSQNRGGNGGGDGQANAQTLANRFKLPDTVRKYRIGPECGKGAFGRVFRCLADGGATVALKCIPTRNVDKERRANIQKEVQLLSALSKHDNIVQYIESFSELSYLFIVLEYVAGGSLQSQLKQYGGSFPEKMVAMYTAQILNGLIYLHSEGIIHRDIKAANILITTDGKAKLADFGVAVRQESGDKNGKGDKNLNADPLKEEVAGSPYWMAPEIIEMKGQATSACDIWAVGATAIELFTGHPPYHNLQAMSALFRIVQDPRPDIPPNASQLFKQFLGDCFTKDPSMRPSATTLQTHIWLKTQINTDNDDTVTTVNESKSNNNEDSDTDDETQGKAIGSQAKEIKTAMEGSILKSKEIMKKTLKPKPKLTKAHSANPPSSPKPEVLLLFYILLFDCIFLDSFRNCVFCGLGM